MSRSTNVLADVLAQLIAWHVTYMLYTWGQRDRSLSKPWPVWFSLCSNWAQETSAGGKDLRYDHMPFWCGSETCRTSLSTFTCRDNYRNLRMHTWWCSVFCFLKKENKRGDCDNCHKSIWVIISPLALSSISVGGWSVLVINDNVDVQSCLCAAGTRTVVV